MDRDLDRAGFTPAERAAFYAALDKVPITELTEYERSLLARYEAASSYWNAA